MANYYRWESCRVYDVLEKNEDGSPARVELFDSSSEVLAEAKQFARSQKWGCVKPQSWTSDDGFTIVKQVPVGFKDEAVDEVKPKPKPKPRRKPKKVAEVEDVEIPF